MVQFKDIQVTVQVHNNDLQEYEDHDEPQQVNVISRYIEAVAGAEFTINIKMLSTYPRSIHSLSYQTCVDGKLIKDALHIPENFDKDVIINGRGHKGVGGWKRRPLSFSEIQPVEDMASKAERLAEQQRALELGVLTVKVFRINITDRLHGFNGNFNELEGSAKVGMKEVQRHSLTHSSKLGEATPVREPEAWNTKNLDSSPFAMFEFKYRSKAALKSLLVVPQTPPPVPLEERAEDSLSPEELRELVRRQRDQIAQLARVKSEASTEGNTRNKREREEAVEPQCEVKKTRK